MKRLVLKLILAATALLGASAVVPGGIVSAYPPGQSGVIRVNVSSVRLNDTFTVTIEGCTAGETVIFKFRGQTVTTTCAGTPGTASATFTPRVNPNRGGAQALDADVPGPGTFEVCGDLTGSGATVPPGFARPSTLCTGIEVLAAAPATTVPATTTPGGGGGLPATTVSPVATTPGGGGLPATGSSGLSTTATSAIVLLGAGTLLLIVSQARRRRADNATA